MAEISSFIADLPSAVQKFWSAVAGPIFEFSIALVVLFFTLGGDEKLESKISSQLGALPRLDDVYGLKALIPIAVLIFIIGIAQGSSKLLRVVGAAIPGKLVPDRTALLLRYAAPLEIGAAWQYSLGLGRVEELNAEIDTTIGRVTLDPKDPLTQIRAMQDQSDTLASTASFIKGLVVVAIIATILLNVFEARPVHWSRLAVTFVVSGVVLIFLAFGRVQAEREYAARKVNDYNQMKRLLPQNLTAPTGDEIRRMQLREIDRQVAEARQAVRSLWSLNFIPPAAEHDLSVLARALIRIWRY